MIRYAVVFFDLDHTLIDTRQQYQLGLAMTVAALHLTAPADFSDRFLAHHEALWAQYDRRECTMLELRRQRFLQTWQSYGREYSVADADEFQREYDRTYESTLRAFAGTAAMLQDIARFHRLGIITNGAPDVQWRKMRIAGIDSFFRPQSVIISELVGQAKPHASVFRHACSALAVNPADAVMVGDNFDVDVQGARDAGLNALWYAPDPQTPAAALLSAQGEQPLRRPEQVAQQLSVLEARRQV